MRTKQCPNFGYYIYKEFRPVALHIQENVHDNSDKGNVAHQFHHIRPLPWCIQICNSTLNASPKVQNPKVTNKIASQAKIVTQIIQATHKVTCCTQVVIQATHNA